MQKFLQRLITVFIATGFALAASGPATAQPQRPTYPNQAPDTICPRATLKALVDSYSSALAAHDPGKAPLTRNIRFTENAVLLSAGNSSLWKGAGAWDLRNDLIDTQRCGTVSWGLIDEDGRPVHAAIRLQTDGKGHITEAEHLTAKEDGFFYNPKAIMASSYLDWEMILPPGERSSREAMTAAANDYFAEFDKTHYVSVPYADLCDRWENGRMTSPTHKCNPPIRGDENIHPPRRIPLVDLEAGIVAAFVHFDRQWDDVHIMKMQRGRVSYMMVVVVKDAKSDGWLPAEKKP